YALPRYFGLVHLQPQPADYPFPKSGALRPTPNPLWDSANALLRRNFYCGETRIRENEVKAMLGKARSVRKIDIAPTAGHDSIVVWNLDANLPPIFERHSDGIQQLYLIGNRDVLQDVEE